MSSKHKDTHNVYTHSKHLLKRDNFIWTAYADHEHKFWITLGDRSVSISVSAI